MRRPKVGSKIKRWFSSEPMGSTILKVEPYTGRYPQWFKWNVLVSEPTTMSGTMKIVL